MQGGGAGLRAGGCVPGRVARSARADEAGQVGEEGELLAHQRAVDAVLAGDLGQQPAQLGRALARRGRASA